MKIGIDISQTVFEGTGVAKYTKNLVENLLRLDKKNEYVLFAYSLRKRKLLKRLVSNYHTTAPGNYQARILPIPPIVMEFLWNQLHVFPIEWFIGKVDVFLSSDWVQPPAIGAKMVTTLHDLIVCKYPESFEKKSGHDIVVNQKRRLKWVKKECDLIICDSRSTRKDAMEILGLKKEKLRVIYPGGIGD